MEEFLAPGRYIDSDHPIVREYAARATAGAGDRAEQIARLFVAVRDGIRYDATVFPREPEAYRASAIAHAESSFCVPKAILLTAGARSLGIPARLAFADVKNHLQTPRMREMMGTDRFYWHGYSELFVDGAWRKASPAFNRELCERFGVAALDFDGTADAVLHPYSGDGSRYMEYLKEHGAFADMPLERFIAVIDAEYPRLAATG